MNTLAYVVIALLLVCALEAEVGLLFWLELRRIRKGRKRIHDRFRERSVNGKCLCPYCTGDANALAELAADYELQLFAALQRLGEA